MSDLVVRPCFDFDLEQVHLIYAQAVTTGFGSFDIAPPPLETMRETWAAIAAEGWPFLVVCREQDPARVLGFAYAQPFRDRAAYRGVFEDSVYVAPAAQGKGAGALLLAALLTELEAQGARHCLALIGDSRNKGSIALHAKLGFHQAGLLHGVGQKFGRVLDVVIMQRALRAADDG